MRNRPPSAGIPFQCVLSGLLVLALAPTPAAADEFTIDTIAGTRFLGFGGDNALATEAFLNSPSGVALDGAGNVYIADTFNHRIRKVDPLGIITTIAGTGDFGFGGDDGPATRARLRFPRGVAVDGAGNVYIADTDNHRIRKVDSSGTMTTFAGNGNLNVFANRNGDGGPAVRAELASPHDVAVDGKGNVYIADTFSDRIRKVSSSGIISTIAGGGGIRAPRGSEADGGPATGAGLDPTYRVAVDGAGNVYFAEGHRRVRRVDPTGIISTFAGGVDTGFGGDGGPAARSRLWYPDGLTADDKGNVYIADSHNNRIRKVDSLGIINTIAGTGNAGFSGDGGLATRAWLNFPHGLAMDGQGSVYIADTSNHRIRKLTPAGISRLFVPIVLRLGGQAGSFFTSELTLTNRGGSRAAVKYTYTASIGTGTSTAEDSLEAGEQRVIPDAIAYLASLGMPIGEGPAGGTLKVEFPTLSSASDAAVMVRTSTPVADGRAGLAYVGLNPAGLLTAPVFLCGLRQNRTDRSNVALQNAGEASDGDTTLRVTVFSGDAADASPRVTREVTLGPGGFHQYSGILGSVAQGYVRVERVSGTAPFYAFGVINDNTNSDGSFVFPVTASSLAGRGGQTLPVIIESRDFQSELMVTNFSRGAKTIEFNFVSDAVQASGNSADFSLTLQAGEQRLIPGLVDWLREQGVAGIGPAGRIFVGALFATVDRGDMSGIVIGARTGSPDGRGGQYGLFYNAVPEGLAFTDSAWVFGLQQNSENRSNLALVNTGEFDDSPSAFEIDVYDGSRESPEPRTLTVTLGARRWHQVNRILGGTSQGYVRVRKVSGNNPFLAYGVINDGATPGQRSDDGAYIPAQP